MSVRKRTWRTSKGEIREAWIVDYVDQQGERHIETFIRKKEADERHAAVAVDVRHGTHTAASKSISVAQACDDWLAFVRGEGRERSTLAQYRQHVELHINPRLGADKLAKLTTVRINAFRDDLLAGISRPLAKKVLTSLKSALNDARRRGNVAQNVAHGVKIAAEKRGVSLKVGVDIPTPEEIKRIIPALAGKRRPLFLTTIFTGLRASELRGLRWDDVDLKNSELNVRQRADRYNAIGKPKSDTSERTIPMPPSVVSTLREWKLACPKSELGLVFPTGTGQIEHHSNIVRDLKTLIVSAGVTTKAGKAKYTGLHAFRHFYASWCINRKVDGGLELPAKLVQTRMGHATIGITLDLYGHLFKSGDDGAELAAAEKLLFA